MIPFAIMTIRFHCGSCSQPIEVDDEWASKIVACPYCRKTVSAPAASTIEGLTDIPVASPLAPHQVQAGPTEQPIPNAGLRPQDKPNTVALAALILASCLLVVLAAITYVGYTHRLEWEDFAKSMMENGDYSQAFDYFESRGGVPRWMIVIGALEVGGGLLWLASLVCGVIGVRHPQRRRLAVAALVIAGIVPLFFCCGGVLMGGGG